MTYSLTARYTSIGTGGRAQISVIRDESELKLRGGEIILGNGSNVLISDEGLMQRVLIMRNCGVTVTGNVITALGGTPLATVVKAAREYGLGGLEWAVGIPGTVGGGIKTNAGAFGASIGDVLLDVDIITPSEKITVDRSRLTMSYRLTEGLPEGVIVGARFLLENRQTDKIAGLMQSHLLYRKKNHPSGRSFGSVFKKADKSAWEYIRQVGLQGYGVGGAEFSAKHANFIINKGNATSQDVYLLIDEAKRRVFGEYGVLLREEVIYMGEFYGSMG